MSNFKNISRRKSILILFSLVLVSVLSCTEELSIADFADDYANYKQELKIEAVLDAADFSKSIIRIDHTILVSDTSLFNGIDDNGDWESYSDLNGNGRWDENEPLNDDIGESGGGPRHAIPPGRGNGIPDPGEPHVDDYIEILPQIQDSSMTSIVLREALSQIFIAEFVWTNQAGSFDQSFGPGGPPEVSINNPYIRYSYGGYVPAPEYGQVQLDSTLQYEMEILTSDGRTITASTDIVGPPINLEWENAMWDGDTLKSPSNNYSLMLWNSSSDSPFCAVIMDEYFYPDSAKGFYASLAVSILDNKETELPEFQGNFIGVPLGIYRVSLESYNSQYGNYVYSGLSIRDRELSNWRDQDGNVVLGAFGAKWPIGFYLRLVSPIG